MRTDLMLRGAELLEADAVNPEGIKFDLGIWAADARIGLNVGDYEANQAFKYKSDTVVPVNCGTQGCAMGLFAISGAFKHEGLSYYILDGVLEISIKGGFYQQRFTGFEAASQLFDIEEPEAQELFSARSYPFNQRKGTAAELAVAARMRQMVTDHLSKNAGIINQKDD